MNTIQITSVDNIQSVAKEFLEKTSDSKVFAFYGSMGVGKTTFIKAICEQLQVIDTVTSPTFAIINEYNTKNNTFVYHFDLYRLKDIQELQNIGAEDYFYSGNICLIEWPEIAEPFLPETYLPVTISETPNGIRKIEF